MLPLFDDDQSQAVALAVESLGRFRLQYNAAPNSFFGMKAKLGLLAVPTSTPRWSTTCSFSCGPPGRLHLVLPYPGSGRPVTPSPTWPDRCLAGALARAGCGRDAMDRVNPVYIIPRNHLSRRPSRPRPTATSPPLEWLLTAAPFDEPGLPLRQARAAGLRGIPDLLRHLGRTRRLASWRSAGL